MDPGPIVTAALAAAAAAPPDGHGVPDLAPVAAAVGAAAGVPCELVVGPDPTGGVEVRFGGEVVGTLRLAVPDEVARAVADALGPVCANARTAARLHELRRAARASATEIGDARLRAAADMDTERRELERDLHDGAQHHLVSLGMTVALLENALATGGDAEPWLVRLQGQLDTAERTLARTAAGILPMTLVRSGLVAALTDELDQERLEAGDVGGRRYPDAVESAIWFTCLEAVNNARKHAGGAAVTVSLRTTARGLAFEVTDEGPGFEVTPSASGLHHMRTRVEAVGGSAEIRSSPGTGTTVSGFVPI